MTGKTVSYLARHKYVVYILFALITVITLFLTLVPREVLEGHSVFEYNLLGHFLMFFGWTFMLGFSIIIHSEKLAPLLLILIAGIAFGIFIELAQLFLPYGRNATLKDVLADAAGSLAAVVLLWGIQTKYQAYLRPVLSKNTTIDRNTLDS